jgi:hypothetical protein
VLQAALIGALLYETFDAQSYPGSEIVTVLVLR